VELDPELATLAHRNVTQFHLEGKIHIVQGDIRFLSPNDLQVICPAVSSGRFDVITANPPYWPLDRGRLNPNMQKAAARHEVFLTLEEVLAAAGLLLKPGGRLYLSHLESRRVRSWRTSSERAL
jgi:tRNA1(Val) A37 N6-methylase TrmN6